MEPGVTPHIGADTSLPAPSSKAPIKYILSYALPHRGFATSGDRPVPGPNLTYWKSNPYLTSKFTDESDALHPQWVVVDLKAEKPVSAVHIQWENPYAIAYEVEYWTGADALDFDEGPPRAMARLSARRDQRRAWRHGNSKVDKQSGFHAVLTYLDVSIIRYL